MESKLNVVGDSFKNKRKMLIMKINVYIDDERTPKNDKYDFIIFRTGEEFLSFLKNNKNITIGLLSLDHDLGADVMDGTKLCTELLYPDINLNIILPKTDEVFFHSGNFEAVKTMRSKFNSAVKVGLISSLVDNKN